MKNEIVLYGTCGQAFWGEDFYTAAQVREQLAGMSGPVTVRVNSGGGIASEGQAIYTMLRDYPDKVSVVVDAVAASAASLIAMAGDTITMRDGAWLLVHDPATPWLESRGTEADHLRAAKQLGVIAGAYASVYAKRAGITREEARQIMKDETVMDGPMAMQLGFADATEDTPAEPVARFDYTIYANAPEVAREASQSLGEGQGRVAVLASIAGVPRITLKQEPVMADENKAVEATSADDKAKNEAAEADTAKAVTTEAIKAERERARRITEITAAAGLPVTMASDMIEKGLTLEAASDLIVAKAAETGDMNRVSMGPARSHILRDERDTMRMAMSQALVAQLAKTKPESDAARPYMEQSIVEMAAEAIGHRGPLRTAFERQEVLASAFHTTSDFPAVFENALNKRLAAAYALATPIYTKISIRQDFTDFRPHPMVNTGSMPLLEKVNEKGEIKYGTIGEKKETVALVAYGIAVGISRQMVINDDLGAIDRLLTTQGAAVARTEEAVFFAMLLGGSGANGPTLNETSRQVFNTTDATLAASGAAISVTSLAAARAAIQKHKGINGEDLALSPKILLCGPDKLTEAEQIIAPIQALESGKVNPFSGLMVVESTPKITGNAWYLLTDPSVQAQFMHGFLQGDAGPRMRMDEPFGVQGIRYSIERDFGVGAIEWRGGWKNPGA